MNPLPQRESPDDAPPSYAAAITRVAPAKSLAPIQIVLTCIAFVNDPASRRERLIFSQVWGTIVAVGTLRNLSDAGETAKLKTLDIIYAVLCA